MRPAATAAAAGFASSLVHAGTEQMQHSGLASTFRDSVTLQVQAEAQQAKQAGHSAPAANTRSKCRRNTGAATPSDAAAEASATVRQAAPELCTGLSLSGATPCQATGAIDTTGAGSANTSQDALDPAASLPLPLAPGNKAASAAAGTDSADLPASTQCTVLSDADLSSDKCTVQPSVATSLPATPPAQAAPQNSTLPAPRPPTPCGAVPEQPLPDDSVADGGGSAVHDKHEASMAASVPAPAAVGVAADRGHLTEPAISDTEVPAADLAVVSVAAAASAAAAADTALHSHQSHLEGSQSVDKPGSKQAEDCMVAAASGPNQASDAANRQPRLHAGQYLMYSLLSLSQAA